MNPRLQFSPVLTLSPSRPYAAIPRSTKIASTLKAIDVLPAPDKPVSQTVQPRNPLTLPSLSPLFPRET